MARGIEANGNEIKLSRKRMGWTQEQLAAEADCAARTIRAAEQGKRVDATTLYAIATALSVSVETLSVIPVTSATCQNRNKETVTKWVDAYIGHDLELLLSLHHPDTVLELPGTAPILSKSRWEGLEELREHLTNDVMKVFEFQNVQQQQLDAVDDLVFHRSVMTGLIRANGASVTAAYFNEFRFLDDKIIWRRTVSDLSEVKENLPKSP